MTTHRHSCICQGLFLGHFSGKFSQHMSLLYGICGGLWSLVVFHWLCSVELQAQLHSSVTFRHCCRLERHCFSLLLLAINHSYTCTLHCLLLGFSLFLFLLYFLSHFFPLFFCCAQKSTNRELSCDHCPLTSDLWHDFWLKSLLC